MRNAVGSAVGFPSNHVRAAGSIGSKQESFYRTAFADKPVALFEGIVLPALRRANEVNEAKKRRLPFLVEQVAQQGRAGEGRKHFEGGKGTCLACHRIDPCRHRSPRPAP